MLNSVKDKKILKKKYNKRGISDETIDHVNAPAKSFRPRENSGCEDVTELSNLTVAWTPEILYRPQARMLEKVHSPWRLENTRVKTGIVYSPRLTNPYSCTIIVSRHKKKKKRQPSHLPRQRTISTLNIIINLELEWKI